MRYSFGKKMLNSHRYEEKALAPKIGRRAERFDPNAQDGDGDGLVQEGTAFERPSTARPAQAARSVSGRMSGIPEISPKRVSDLYDGVKSFDGMDYKFISDSLQSIIDNSIEKHGEITTARDALEALKKVAGKVELKDFGNLGGGRADLNHRLSMAEAYAIHAILHTFNNAEHLKKRKLTIEHTRNNDGSLNDGGANAVMPKIRIDGRPDHPEYAIKMFIPFDFDTVRNELLVEARRNDGVAIQMARELLLEAEKQSDPQERDTFVTSAVIAYIMGVASHEAIHAIDMPERYEEIAAEAQRINPSAAREFERLVPFSQDKSDVDILKLDVMGSLISSMGSSSIGEAIQMAIVYNNTPPSESVTQMRNAINDLENVRSDVENQMEQARAMLDDMDEASPFEVFAIRAFVDSAQEMIDDINAKIYKATSIAEDLEKSIENGSPETSMVGNLHKQVYDNGLNFLFEIIPPGLPGHKTDITMTVDEFGNSIPFTIGGEEIKDPFSTSEFMEAFILAIHGQDGFFDAMDDLGLSLNQFEAILRQPSFIKTDANGNKEFDVSDVLENLDPADLERNMSIIANRFVAGYSSSMWPQGMPDSLKWRLLEWMRQVSNYGSRPHAAYRNRMTFFSPSSVSSAEVTTELISSLIFGTGAARVPMPPDVRKAVIDILNWVYKGSSWKSILPPISLEALGA